MINVLSYFAPEDHIHVAWPGLACPGVSPVQRQSSSVSWRSVMAETGGSQSVTQSLWSIMSFLLKDASLSNYHKGISLHNI